MNPSLNIVVLAFQYPFLISQYEWNGVRVYSFGGKNKGKLQRLLLWRRVRQKLKTIITENNVAGILNFWLGECALVSKYISKKYSIRSFTWMIGQDARKGNRFIRYIRPQSGSLIALSDSLCEEFYSNYGIRPAYTIPLGIDTAEFNPTVPERRIDVLGAGSLIQLKQYDVFIRIIAALRYTNANIKAVICGAGPEKERLQRMIGNAGLENNISLAGEIAHAEVLQLMQSSKVFLHPSSYEGFGGVCA
ncbi:MAG: glycosyltransferase family 4 protein, partial [Chitinophagaceae bacterium]|nr:glycosyltransferase family 4 protein [Chitinophagaceae bacterium]